MLEALCSTEVGNWRTSLVIVLDWYDGPREGFCLLSTPEVECYFKVIAERPTEDGLDDRLFALASCQAGTLSNLVDSLQFAGVPTKPVWVPVWASTGDGVIEQANATVDRAKLGATETRLILRTADFVSFQGIWSLPRDTPVRDWFAFVGETDPVSSSP